MQCQFIASHRKANKFAYIYNKGVNNKKVDTNIDGKLSLVKEKKYCSKDKTIGGGSAPTFQFFYNRNTMFKIA